MPLDSHLRVSHIWIPECRDQEPAAHTLFGLRVMLLNGTLFARNTSPLTVIDRGLSSVPWFRAWKQIQVSYLVTPLSKPVSRLAEYTCHRQPGYIYIRESPWSSLSVWPVLSAGIMHWPIGYDTERIYSQIALVGTTFILIPNATSLQTFSLRLIGKTQAYLSFLKTIAILHVGYSEPLILSGARLWLYPG